MKPLPQKLRDWRRAQGLSQLEAAARLNLPVGTLRRWEQGRHEPQGLAKTALLVLIEEPKD